MADSEPRTFNSDLEDEDSTPSDDSPDDNELKSMFHVHKRFHIPRQRAKQKCKPPDMSGRDSDESTDTEKDEEKQDITQKSLVNVKKRVHVRGQHHERKYKPPGAATDAVDMSEPMSTATESEASSTKPNNSENNSENTAADIINKVETNYADPDNDLNSDIEHYAAADDVITDTMLQDIVDPKPLDMDRDPMESFVVISIDPDTNTISETKIVGNKVKLRRPCSSADEEEFTTPKECFSDGEDAGKRILNLEESIKSATSEESIIVLGNEKLKKSVVGVFRSISSSVSESELANTNLVKDSLPFSEDCKQFSASSQDIDNCGSDNQSRVSIMDKIKMFNKQNCDSDSESPERIRKSFKKAEIPINKSDSSPHIPAQLSISVTPKPLIRPTDESGDAQQIDAAGMKAGQKLDYGIEEQFEVEKQQLETDERTEDSQSNTDTDINKIQMESQVTSDIPPPIPPKSQVVLDSMSAIFQGPATVDDVPPPILARSQAVLDSMVYTGDDRGPSDTLSESVTPLPIPSKSITRQLADIQPVAQIPEHDVVVDNVEPELKVKPEEFAEIQHDMGRRRESETIVSSTDGDGSEPDYQLPPSVPHSASEGFLAGCDPNVQHYNMYGMMPQYPQEVGANFYPPMIFDEHGDYYIIPPPPYPYSQPMNYGAPFPNQPMGPPYPSEYPSEYGMPPSDFHGGMPPGHGGPGVVPPYQGYPGVPQGHQGVPQGHPGMPYDQVGFPPSNISPEAVDPHYTEIGDIEIGEDEKTLASTIPSRQERQHPVSVEQPVAKTMEKQQTSHRIEIKDKKKSMEPLGTPLASKPMEKTGKKYPRQQRKSTGQIPHARQTVNKEGSPAIRQQPSTRRHDQRNIDDKAGGRGKQNVKKVAEPSVDHQSYTKTTPSLKQKHDEETAIRKQPPAPKQDSYVYIKGLTASSSADNISNFVEAGAGVGVTARDNSLIFNLDHTAALITFIGKPDFDSLKKRLSAKKLGGSKLTVYEMPVPTRLAVSCEDAIHSTDNLMYYFEREQIGGGEIKGKVSQSEDGSCYVIEFKDPVVVRRLCSGEHLHVLDNVELRVSPYFSCTAGVIWDTKLHAIAIPNAVKLDLTAAVAQFLQRPCCGDLHSQMKKKHVDIMFTEDGVTLTCTLTPKMEDLRTLVQKWKSDTKNQFQAYLDNNVCTKELGIQLCVWSDLVKFCKSGGVDNVVIIEDVDNGKFVITGFPQSVKETIDILDKKAVELDRKNHRTTKKQTFQSSLRMRLLEGMNVFKDINSKIDDITIQTDDRSVTIEGVPEDIQKAILLVLEKYSANEETTYPHRYSSNCVDFIMKEPTMVRFINKELVNNDLQAEWEVTMQGITVVTPSNVSQRSVAKAIEECVTEWKITILDEAVELFSEEQWKKLDNDISRKFKGEVKLCFPTTNSLLVFGLTKQMHDVRNQIEAFMEENTIRHEKVKTDRMKLKFVNKHVSDMCRDIMEKLQTGRVKLVVRDSGIEVSGTKAGIKKAKAELSSRMDAIISKHHTMKMVAVRDVFNSALDKEIDDAAVGGRTGSNSASKFRIKNGAEVLLVKGEIGKQDGDVMVVTTSPSLNLKSGAACRSLLDVAGPGMQQDCKAKYPKDIGHGELAHIQTKRSGLECNAVYLTSLPDWSAGGHAQQTLEKFMTSCLEKASKDNRYSILFCAMGTGQLSYPRDVVAMVMYQAAIDFGNKYSSSSLKEIKFVLYQKDTETIKAVGDWAAKNPKSSIQTVKFVMYAKDHKLIQTFKSHVMRSQNKVSRTGRNLNQTEASSGSSGSQKYNASNDETI